MLCAAALTITQCTTKDKDTFTPQSHDENIFMNIMHSSMDSMMTMKMTMDTDHDFALMMKLHHEGAVLMADKVLSIGADTTIKRIATNIKNSQAGEIAQLNSFLASHKPVMEMVNNPKFMAESDMAMDKMMASNDLRPLTGKNDFDFAQLMVDHHQSAIEMAESVLKYGDEQFTKNMATMVIEDQRKEIMRFNEWMLKNRPYGNGGHSTHK